MTINIRCATMELIRIKNLSYRFKNQEFGLYDINLSINEGEFVLFAGKNGSGKTTLLRHINGLITSYSGDIFIGGLNVKQNTDKVKQLVGLIFQDADTQIVGETVYADAAFGPENLRMKRDEIDKRVKEVLEAVGLSDYVDKRTHTLSGGEKRRLGIAGVLAMKPQIIIFDEPFSNLDYSGILQVLEQIKILRNEKKTILMATHDFKKVLAYTDKIVIMDNGRIVNYGGSDDMFAYLQKLGITE